MIAFGPVPSRRLGRSLGINNITPGKVCSYSCVYCQIGITRNLTAERKVFFSPEVLFCETEKHLNRLDRKMWPDYITFVANGEPTADINLGIEIDMLKRFNLPVAVITNSSFINDAAVREDLAKADWVSLKIDTIRENVWLALNQPAKGINLDGILKGIEKFASEYKGRLHTETMLTEGFNDDVAGLLQTSTFIARIKPETAYLSVPIRPPAVRTVKPVSEATLFTAWNIFDRLDIKTELLTGFEGTGAASTGNAAEDILNITSVHPLREDSMMELLGKSNATEDTVHELISQGMLKSAEFEGHTFYIRSFT